MFRYIVFCLALFQAALAVPAFSGKNTGIASWFRTDSSSDSTNGHSWCGLNYQDSWYGFAPDVSTMISASGSAEAAKKDFCGLEIKATSTSTGKTVTMYLVDGFDPAWVRTPGSIDITVAAFTELHGHTTDKNTVDHVEWYFTGKRKSAYAYN